MPILPSCHNLRFIVCVAFIFSIGAMSVDADVVLYSNNFDGNVVTGPGVSVGITGGDQATNGVTGGIVNGQGYSTSTGFGGSFWHVTTANDNLQFQLNNTPVNYVGTVEFSLAVIDSWDGSAGPDHIEVEILDGATQQVFWQQTISGGTTPSSNVDSVLVLNQDFGFNQGPASEPWWLDDGYRIKFDNIPLNSGSLTFRITPTGAGFQGGNDESFAIDNILITAVPEPSTMMIGMLLGCTLAVRRRRHVSEHSFRA